MISYLHGQAMLETDGLTILVQGVGYAVHPSPKLLRLAVEQQPITAYIYTHVREDQLELFGFAEKSEREVFLLLLSVSGVGPKTALGILRSSTLEITEAIQNADIALFSAAPRVGKKLAQKIIIELRNKVGALKELDLSPATPQKLEVVQALTALGFADSAIQKAISEIDIESVGLQGSLKAALKILAKQ